MNQEAIERAARALNHAGWTCFEGSDLPGNYDECEDCKRVCDDQARAVIAAIHPTVDSVEGLDALPDGAAVLDSEGDVAEKYENRWHFLGGPPLTSSTLASFGKLTVLYTPGGAA